MCLCVNTHERVGRERASERDSVHLLTSLETQWQSVVLRHPVERAAREGGRSRHWCILFFPVNFLSLFGRKTNVGLGRGGGGGGGGRLGLETLGLASGETHPEISHSPTDADFSLQSVAAFLAARPLCAAALGFRYRKRTEREREREKEPFCLHLATPTAALLLIPPPPLQNPSSPLGPSLSLLYWPSQSSFFPSDNPPHHHLLVLLSAFSPF